MPDTHLPLHDARTAAHISRISTHAYGRSDLLSSQSESAYGHEC